MSYNIDDVEKILNFTSWSNKRKIDTLFEIDADLYCNLGSESSKTEVEKVKDSLVKYTRLSKQSMSIQEGYC